MLDGYGVGARGCGRVSFSACVGSWNECGSEPAREAADRVVSMSRLYPVSCGSWLASEGGLMDCHVLGSVHIHCCGNGYLWLRSYSGSLFSNAKKVTKKSRPKRPAPRLGSAYLRSGIHPGTSPPVCCAAPPFDVCGFAARRCAPTPRMNASTQPSEGAGGSKATSKACKAS